MTIAEHCTMHEKLTDMKVKRNGKILKEAEKMLTDNEEILYAVLFLEGFPKVLVVTNKKVFTCKGTLSSAYTETLNLKDITSVDKTKAPFALTKGELIIRGITQVIKISLYKKAQSILDDIQKTINSAKENLENSNTINNNSVNYLEELERLADLKEKGILSEEEFNTKKQQILDNN